MIPIRADRINVHIPGSFFLMTFEQFLALFSVIGAFFIFVVLPVLCLRGVCYIPQNKIGIVEKRFGDVKSLVSQTLDPILTAYFRDVAQSSSMLDLLTISLVFWRNFRARARARNAGLFTSGSLFWQIQVPRTSCPHLNA